MEAFENSCGIAPNQTQFVSEGFLLYEVMKHLNAINADILPAGIAMSNSEEQKSGQIRVIKMVWHHTQNYISGLLHWQGKNPEYGEVVMPSRNEAAHNIAQEDLNMMQNVAYGPLKLQRWIRCSSWINLCLLEILYYK